MNKKIKMTILLMVAAALLATTASVMAAAPDKIPLADGIQVEDTMTNQMTVVSVGEVPDPKYKNFSMMMDGQGGVAAPPTIREVVLKDKDGNQQTMTLGKEMKNFDQIKVGDLVTFTVSRQVAFYLGKEGMVPGMGESSLKFSAPKGSKPGGIEVKESFVTLEIMKLNAGKKEVTVRLPDNTVKTVVTPNLDFLSVKVGQNVIVKLSSEQSIVVTAPN
jgi:hypothetical protein